MERTREVAAFGRGGEVPPHRVPRDASAPKRVLYGVWDGTKKIAASQSPEAWGNRILGLIGSKIVPRLRPEQQLWVLKNASGIEDAAMVAGAGITTAEIVLAVVVAEKGIRRLFPHLVKPALELRRVAPDVSPQSTTAIRDMLVKSEIVTNEGVRAELLAVAGALIAAGIDPTVRDVAEGFMSGNQRKRALGEFQEQHARVFHQQFMGPDGRRLPDSYVNQRFFAWMNMLREGNAPGHRYPEMERWVIGREHALENAIERDITRSRKEGRHRRRMLRKKNMRDFKHAGERFQSYQKRKNAAERKSESRDVHDHSAKKRTPKAHRADWDAKPTRPNDAVRESSKGQHALSGSDRYLTHVSRALEHDLDAAQRARIGTVLDRLTDTTRPGVMDGSTYWLLRQAMEEGNTQEAVQTLRNVFSRAMFSGETNPEHVNFFEYDQAFDAYLGAGAPGLLRVLRVAGIPSGMAKNFLRTLRRVPGPPDVTVRMPEAAYQEMPGFTYVVQRMHDVPPPPEVYDLMRDAVRFQSQQGSAITREYRETLARQIAAAWVDNALPKFANRPEAREAFLQQLEAEGFPGLPRMTVQGLQEYLDREYLPVSRAQRVIDRLRQELPKVFREKPKQPRSSASVIPSPNTESRIPASVSPEDLVLEGQRKIASREQSRRQREHNEYMRQLRKAVRKIERDRRKAVVEAIEKKLQPERKRLRKLSRIHAIARETPKKIKKAVKRMERIRERIGRRKERLAAKQKATS